MWVSEVWGQGCDVTCPLRFGARPGAGRGMDEHGHKNTQSHLRMWTSALPLVLNASGIKLFSGFRNMIANTLVCYAHRGISGLSFLHRGKRLSLLILRKCCVMSYYFLLFNLFQLDFSCAAHMRFPSLSSSFSSSYLYYAPARQGDFPYCRLQRNVIPPTL